jgi:hypothetical protein
MKQNVHRIGSKAFEHNGKTVIIIEESDFDVHIILLEQLIAGEYKIICIDIDEDDETFEIEYYVMTDIPWNIYKYTPDPNLKYFRHENLN